MVHWVGTQGQVGDLGKKCMKTCLHHVTHKKPQTYFKNLSEKTFWICRGFEQLSSVIDWWVMVLKS